MNVTERFLRYVSYPTNSDEQSESCPSTAGQLALGAALAEELPDPDRRFLPDLGQHSHEPLEGQFVAGVD